MRVTISHAIIAVMAIVIAALSWALIYFSRDELKVKSEGYEEEIETATVATVDDGRAIVRVNVASQTASGIRVTALTGASGEAAVEVYGIAVDIQPLLDLRGRYFSASGQVRAARAALAAAEGDYKRAELLYRDDRNVSEQALRNAESRFRAEQAQLSAASATMSVTRDSLRTAWGDVITGWATNPNSLVLQALLTRRSHLVQLAFPYELPRSAARSKISVAPVTGRANVRPARYVSDSPQVDMALPGQTYFYMVDGGDLRAGSRVVARVTTGKEKRSGVVVPNEAVVWHAGKSWAYVKRDAETFSRHEISTANELGDGWFNSGELNPGDQVVVSGAQLLLSEELKFQIRNENED